MFLRGRSEREQQEEEEERAGGSFLLPSRESKRRGAERESAREVASGLEDDDLIPSGADHIARHARGSSASCTRLRALSRAATDGALDSS